MGPGGVPGGPVGSWVLGSPEEMGGGESSWRVGPQGLLLGAAGLSPSPHIAPFKDGGHLTPCVPPQCPPGCLGLARLLLDCESCLVFGGAGGAGPGRPRGPFGWCVQNDTCLPVAGEWGAGGVWRG